SACCRGNSAAVARSRWPLLPPSMMKRCSCRPWLPRPTASGWREPCCKDDRRSPKRWGARSPRPGAVRTPTQSLRLAKRMPDPVVVTRPLAQAHELAERVRALGREAVLFPLLEISALPDDSGLRAVLANLSSYAMVVFVSPNAIDAAFRLIDTWPAEVAIAVVGEGSRRALERHGVTDANARIFRPNDPLR